MQGTLLLVAFVVWLSTTAVSRMPAIVLGAKVITFFLTFGSLMGHVTPTTLFNVAESNASYTPYLLMTLPFSVIVAMPPSSNGKSFNRESTVKSPISSLSFCI